MGKNARQTLATVASFVATGRSMDRDTAIAVLSALQTVCKDLERVARRRVRPLRGTPSTR